MKSSFYVDISILLVIVENQHVYKLLRKCNIKVPTVVFDSVVFVRHACNIGKLGFVIPILWAMDWFSDIMTYDNNINKNRIIHDM